MLAQNNLELYKFIGYVHTLIGMRIAPSGGFSLRWEVDKFQSGNCRPQTAVRGWRRSLEHVCRAAKLRAQRQEAAVPAAHAAAYLAIKKLNAGASLEDVSLLLSHHSVKLGFAFPGAGENVGCATAGAVVLSLPNARLMWATKKPPKGGVTRGFDVS